MNESSTDVGKREEEIGVFGVEKDGKRQQGDENANPGKEQRSNLSRSQKDKEGEPQGRKFALLVVKAERRFAPALSWLDG